MITDTLGDPIRSFRARLKSFLNRSRGWQEISGYHVGDIHSEEPVRVHADAVVDGDVLAPKVIVGGKIHGFVVSLELLVETGGQIWGDVYTRLLMKEPGGQINGWCSTIDEDGYLLLSSGQVSVAELVVNETALLPEDIPSGAAVERNGGRRLAILRRIRAEASAALVAQAELETTFDQQLAQKVGEKVAETARLREELLLVKGELLTLEKQQEAIKETLRIRDLEVAEQREKAARLESSMSRQAETLDELRREHAEDKEARETFEAQTAELDIELRAERVRADVLADRVQNLEIALQASLQRAADQQEALMRWQELAELAEARADGIEEELKASQVALEVEVQRAQAFCQQGEELEEKWLRTEEELKIVRNRLKTTDPAQEAAQAELATLRQRLADLQKDLDQHQQMVQERDDQLAWLKTSLETATSDLAEAREQARQQAALSDELRQAVQAAQAQCEEWKNNVGRMTRLLYEAQQRIKQMGQQLNQSDAAGDEKKVQLQKELHHRMLQMKALEAEVESYTRSIGQQRSQLAGLQARLVEREAELSQLRPAFEKQSRAFHQLQLQAARRIAELEQALARVRQRPPDGPPELLG